MISQKPTGMPNRQKIISGVVVVILIIVVWQIIGMFSGKKSTPPATNIVANHPTTTTTTTTTKAQGPAPVAQPSVQAQPQAQPQQSAVQHQVQEASPVSKDVEFLRAQQQVQQQYINSLNELQMLRIRKEIAETNQAIATAKLATVTAEKSISDVLTQPSAFAPPSPSQSNIPSAPAAQYVVISVAMQNEKWTAVLDYQGKLYNVSVGDILPADGSVVIKIARDGIILEKNGERTKISILSAI